METLLQDLRFALRSLWKARLTTILAVLCLALGIGANTAIFSVVRAVLLQSLPYGNPQRLVMAYESYVSVGRRSATGSVAPANYFAWQKEKRIFTDLAAYMPITRDLGDIADPERLRGVKATTNLFALLGVRPLAGRTFLTSDQPPVAAPVVIISEGLWRRQFGASPDLIGSAITLGGTRVTVVGVMPAYFDFPVSPVHNDFWVPFDWRTVGDPTNRGNHSLAVVGRLAPGVDSAHAMRDLAVVAHRLAVEFPDAQRNRGIQIMGKDLSHVLDAQVRIVSGGCFAAMGIPVVAGREFDDHDTRAGEHVVVINDELARRYFGGTSPLGRLLTTADEGGRIVGVVRSVRQLGLDQEAQPEFYLPASQALYSLDVMTFVLRARGDPAALARSVRETVRSLAPQSPVFQLATMDDVISDSLTTRRLVLVLLAAFALLALVLAAAGVYGVMSYGVSQRRREIGIRLALGARGGDVLAMILGGVTRVLAVGIFVGLLASAVLTRSLESLLYGVAALDPLTFVAVPAIIAIVGLVAGAVPAVRAARVDPLESMRAD